MLGLINLIGLIAVAFSLIATKSTISKAAMASALNFWLKIGFPGPLSTNLSAVIVTTNLSPKDFAFLNV